MGDDNKIRKTTTPCKGCTKETGRSSTCHTTCSYYLDFCKLNEEVKKSRHKHAMDMRIDKDHRERTKRK